MSEKSTPYVSLGKRLKYVREQSEQSLAEVSGAVEIEEQRLARIEAGQERPAEEILLLLISYFGVQERDAISLWELANYDSSELPDQIKSEPETSSTGKPAIMLLALDTRTMYSDGLDVHATQAGLTLVFTQATGKSQSAPIARVGMSYEQTEQVIQTLQQALLRHKYNNGHNLLPPPKSQD